MKSLLHKLSMLRLRNRTVIWIAAGVLAGAALTRLAVTADTPKRVNRSAISSGGSTAAQSPQRQVSGTLGQLADGRATSATRELGAGFWNTAVPACDCRYHGDLDANGVVNVFDVVKIVDAAFRNGAYPPKDPFCPHMNRGDYNCDNIINVSDVVLAVNIAFRNGALTCDPCKKK